MLMLCVCHSSVIILLYACRFWRGYSTEDSGSHVPVVVEWTHRNSVNTSCAGMAEAAISCPPSSRSNRSRRSEICYSCSSGIKQGASDFCGIHHVWWHSSLQPGINSPSDLYCMQSYKKHRNTNAPLSLSCTNLKASLWGEEVET